MTSILTIAIPTFNRFNILKENLELIFDELNNEIQILVCDNNSSDKTNFVCKEFLKYENFTYLKNEKNIGYDANVLTALVNSDSRYVWFLSDDDFIDKNLIKYVYNYLIANEPDAVLINAIVKNKETNAVIIDSLGTTNENTVELCSDSTFLKYLQWSTLISSIIVKKENVSIDKATSYIGSCFIQLSIFWNSSHNKNIHILGSKKIVKFDSEKPNFNLNNYEIWFKSWVTVVSSFTNIFTKDTTKKAATSLYTNSKFNTAGILVYVAISKSYNIISLKDYKFIDNNLDLLLHQRLVIFLILLLPNSLFTSLIWLRRELKTLVKNK